MMAKQWRGSPLNICKVNHQVVTFYGSVCPLCEMRAEMDRLKDQLKQLTFRPKEEKRGEQEG